MTDTGPNGVATHAVTLTGFHSDRGTQNHIPTFTTMLFIDGAVRTSNMLMARETRERADSATRPGALLRTQ